MHLARLALAMLGAVLLAAPVHRAGTWLLGCMFLAPLLIATRRARPIEAAALGVLCGALYGMLISLWIPGALQELGSSRATALAGWVGVATWAETPAFAALALTSRWTNGLRPGWRAAALAAIGYAAESWMSRSWQGVPWGLFGSSQLGALGVAQLAALGGVPLISALLIAVNSLLADVGSRRPGAGQLAVPALASWLALAAAGLPLAEWMRPRAEGTDPAIDLLLVQTDIPRGERWGETLQLLNLHRARTFADRALAAEPPGIAALVLPENLITTPVDASPDLTAALDAWVSDLGVPVLTGLVLAADPPARDRYRSSVVWLEPGRGITARFDKERAIPILESSREFPSKALLALLFGEAAQWKKVQEVAGSPPLVGPAPVVPLLCYEVLFPELAARRRTPDSIALVNLADDGWAPGSAASRHLTQLARFRAIEQRLPLVRVAHGGLSAVIDEFGRVTAELPLDAYASRRVSLRALPPPSGRERAALAALPIGAFAVAWCAVRWVGRKRKRGRAW